MSLFSLITSHMPLALPRTLSAAISSPAPPRTPSPIGVRVAARPQLIGCLHLVHLRRHVFPCKLRKDVQDADQVSASESRMEIQRRLQPTVLCS